MRRALSKNSRRATRDDVDADVFGIAHDELAAAVQQFIVRGGRIRGVRSWVVDKELDVELGDLVETVLQRRIRRRGGAAAAGRRARSCRRTRPSSSCGSPRVRADSGARHADG